MAAAEAVGGGREEKAPAYPGKVVREVAARRSTSIKLVVEENGGGDSLREFSMFVSSIGDTIFTQSWTPVQVQIRWLKSFGDDRLLEFVRMLSQLAIMVYLEYTKFK